jgi:hypothetical protein
MGDTTKGLTNSRRRFEKASYTPVKTRQRDESETGDVMARAALVRGLGTTPSELVMLRTAAGTESELAAVDAIAQLMESRVADSAIRAAATLAEIPDRELISIAGRLETLRSESITRLSAGVKELSKNFDQVQRDRCEGSEMYRTASATSRYGPSLPSTVHSAMTSLAGGESSEDASEALRTPTDRAPDLRPPRDRDDLAPTAGDTVRAAAYEDSSRLASAAASLLQPSATTLRLATAHPFTATTFGTLGAARLPSVLIWAAEAVPDKLEGLLTEARPYLPLATAASVVDLVGSLAELERRRMMANVFVTALTRRPLEPVGLLHLERLEMTPLEIERGELVYSLPLAPHEKVTMAHKEWTTREEEFSRYIQDFFENFSETGVAEADDIAMSSLTQTRHANALSMNQSPVGTSGVTITNAADGSAATSSVEDLASIEESKSHARTVTSKATARSIKDHKVSFTVTTVSGVEDFTARVLENTRDNEAMRIDYFRRMRRWRMDLYRYGVRMTYDVVLPDPGRRVRRRHALIQAIDEQLASGSQFTLKPSDVTVWNWRQLADLYGAVLESPRELQRRFEVVRQLDYGPAEEVNIHGTVHTRQKVEEMQVDIPADYHLSSLLASVQVSTWHVTFQQRWITVIGDGVVRGLVPDGSGHISGTVFFDPQRLPQTGPIKVSFQSQYVSNGVLKLSGTMEPREAVVEDWRMRCWMRLRDAANASRARLHDELRARRGVLEREIVSMDALTLRRMEREQIMLSVLEWLFPEFDETIGSLYSIALPGSWATGVWQDIMEYGEYIKFVHEAIDWDNVMIFLFPYFWDTPSHHEEKLFLDHKDPLHREFLRAGAARVVLAIRPGFEEEVASLLDQGQLGALPNGHRFKKVAADVRAANAEYAKQAERDGDDEDHDNPRIPGTLIGSWFDYTPTGALDIDVITSRVQSS